MYEGGVVCRTQACIPAARVFLAARLRCGVGQLCALMRPTCGTRIDSVQRLAAESGDLNPYYDRAERVLNFGEPIAYEELCTRSG